MRVATDTKDNDNASIPSVAVSSLVALTLCFAASASSGCVCAEVVIASLCLCLSPLFCLQSSLDPLQLVAAASGVFTKNIGEEEIPRSFDVGRRRSSYQPRRHTTNLRGREVGERERQGQRTRSTSDGLFCVANINLRHHRHQRKG